MSEFRVAVADARFGSYREEEEVLKEVGAELVMHDLASDAEAIEALKDVDGVLLNLFPLGAKVIRRMKKCRIISRYGVGYDNVDVEAATNQGIWISNVPDYAYEDVSDHALGMLLDCVRKITIKDRRIRRGDWNLHSRFQCRRIKDKILGFIGYGGIARALHRKVSGLGLAKVLVFDPYIDREYIRDNGGDPCDFETLLKESDFISIHAPLTKETRRLIGAKQLAMMKEEAILINTSRGPLINEAALAKALQEKKIGFAGLDVFESEPLQKDSPLKKLDNVILTDHAGWYTEESLVELKTKAAMNIAEVFRSGKPIYPVNQV
jgi:D-3-phosphoglycerate dehydrogenase